MDSPLLRWDVSSRREVALARMKALGTSVAVPPSTFSLRAESENNENNADRQEELSTALSDTDGLAVPLTSILSSAYDEWLRSARVRCKQVGLHIMTEGLHEEKKDDDEHDNSPAAASSSASTTKFIVHETQATNYLRQVLQLHTKVCQLDSTLAEELGREGSHAVLAKLIRFDMQSEIDMADSIASFNIEEEDADAVMELQDLACEIAAICGGSFPMKVAPFTLDALRSRLPLHFIVSSVPGHNTSTLDCQQHHILIHQVTARRQGAQEDVGFVMWPSAVVLASWVASNPSKVLGKRCLEIGSGCGLTGLATAAIFAAHRVKDEESQIILTDFNETVLQNADRNIHLNDLGGCAATTKLDFYLQTGTNVDGGWIDGSRTTKEPVDVVLAADVICKPEDAVAAANTIYDALRPGGHAYVISGSAKHRFGVDRFKDECLRVGLEVEISNISDIYDGALVSSSQGEDGRRGIEQCSGYVDGMTLSFFHVTKPRT